MIGSMAVEGSVITWVADHRKHHAFTDQEGDPHSPHLAGPGFWGGVKGLWHAHVGWLFETVGTADRDRFAADLVKDRALRVIDKLFGLWVLVSFAIPFALGWIVGGGLGAALTACCGAGSSACSCCTTSPGRSTRSATSSDASASISRTSRATCSGWRRSRWARRGTTTTTPSPPRPSTACAGGSAWPTRPDWLIALFEKLGLVWNVVRVSPERQRAKLLAADEAARASAKPVRRPGLALSSGAIVSPAASSRSQYCWASSRGPLHTIA